MPGLNTAYVAQHPSPTAASENTGDGRILFKSSLEINTSYKQTPRVLPPWLLTEQLWLVAWSGADYKSATAKRLST